MIGAPHGIHIVGGGLTGYAAALLLVQDGYQATLYDRQASAGDNIRTTTINPVSFKTLDGIGALALLPPTSISPINEIIVSDDTAQQNPLEPLMSWQGDDTPLAWVVRNSDLAKALRECAVASHHVTIHDDVTISDYQRDQPTPSATLITKEGKEILSSLTIAADGRGGKMRNLAGIRSITRASDQAAIVADLSLGTPHHGRAWQRFAAGGPIAFMPIADERQASMVWTLAKKEAEKLMIYSDEEFNVALNEHTNNAFGGVSVASQRQSFPVTLSHTPRPYGQRLALIGDAAHSINPLAGQGYNLALGDIKSLIKALSWGTQHGVDLGSDQVLRHYARARLVEVAAMTAMTDGLNCVFSLGGKTLRRVAAQGMVVAAASPIKTLAEKIASGQFFTRD